MEEMILNAGVSKIEITTDKICVNDPLYAKVLVLEYAGEKSVLVSLDYVSMGGGISELSDAFFGNLKHKTQNMGFKTLLCATTHTHTHFPMCQEEGVVLENILMAINQASENMCPVKVGAGVGHCDSFIINRTLRVKNGGGWTIRQAHPCPKDEDIIGLNDADDSIGVLRVDRLDNTPLCVLFTFGCHPLVGYTNNRATANYPGIAERFIEEHTGAMAMMFQSCGGDVTEIDYKDYDQPKNCTFAGLMLGQEVLRVVKRIEMGNSKITTAHRKMVFPLRTDFSAIREKLLQEREEIFQSMGGCPLNFKAFLPLYMKYLVNPEYPLDYAYAYMAEERRGSTQLKEQDEINRKNIEKYLQNLQAMERLSWLSTTLETLAWHEKRNTNIGTEIESEIVGIKIGDCVLISAPVEPLSALGARMREYAVSKKTFLIGYANGFLHYGAPPEVYNNGGYETIECMLAPTWLDIYEKAAQSVVNELEHNAP